MKGLFIQIPEKMEVVLKEYLDHQGCVIVDKQFEMPEVDKELVLNRIKTEHQHKLIS
jgi:hypothetical protein